MHALIAVCLPALLPFCPPPPQVYKVTIGNMRPSFPDWAPPPLRALAEDCWQSDEAARPGLANICARLAAMREPAQMQALRLGAQPPPPPPQQQAVAVAEAPSGTAEDVTMQSPWIMHCNFDL